MVFVFLFPNWVSLCLVLDKLDGVAGVVADERERSARVVVEFKDYFHTLGLQLCEDGANILHPEGKVLEAVCAKVLRRVSARLRQRCSPGNLEQLDFDVAALNQVLSSWRSAARHV